MPQAPRSVKQDLGDDGEPSLRLVLRAAVRNSVPLDWLLLGEGPGPGMATTDVLRRGILTLRLDEVARELRRIGVALKAMRSTR